MMNIRKWESHRKFPVDKNFFLLSDFDRLKLPLEQLFHFLCDG